MHNIFPKVNEVFSYHLKNFEVINSLMSAISLRVEAEEQYERAITKSVQKVSDIQTDHPLYSKIIKSFKSLISERVHQVRFFKEQIAKEADTLKTALAPVEEQMKAQLSELRNMEKDLRSNFDLLTKNRAAVEQRCRELDQKFILNEVTALYKMNKGLRKTSETIFNEEVQLVSKLEKDWDKLRQGVTKFESGAQERERKIGELDIRVEEEFVDFFKKLNVHQISLIRNIQYDIDNMIKKTDIFNWQNTNEFKDRFSLRFSESLQFNYPDPYNEFKKNLLREEEVIANKQNYEFDENRFNMIVQKLTDKKEGEEFLTQLKKNYAHYRYEIYEYIESFRKAGKFKFQPEIFKFTFHVFRQILRVAISCIDFECIQKVILFSNSYYCPNYQNAKKRTILDELRSEKTLGDLAFWKFFLLFNLRQSVAHCLTMKEEREIHTRSGVYSTLLSNSLTMVECGIEKHNIKNLIGKLAKTYGSLSEAQVAQLLKVVETAYENMQKVRKKKQ